MLSFYLIYFDLSLSLHSQTQQPSSAGAGPPPSAPPTNQPQFKHLSVPETLDRLKEEFSLLQAQNQR